MSNVVQEEGAREAPDTDIPDHWKQTVLACDGGGIRGYVTLLLLKSLMQEVANEERFADQALRHEVGITHYTSNTDPLKHLPPLPCHYFDYIIGTSTGGLIAIMLGRLRMGVNQCIREYEKLGSMVFRKKRRLRYYRYNHQVLHNSIVDVVSRFCLDRESPRNGQDKMLHPGSSGSACRTVVLAVERRDGQRDQIHPFTSYQRVEGDAVLSPISPRNPAIVYIHAAARATSAAPGFFREADVLGSVFMDGALMANNPSNWAWKEVWAMHDASRSASNGANGFPTNTRPEELQNGSQCPIGVFVSMGTGLRAPRSAFRRGDPVKKIGALLGKAIGDMTDTEAIHEDLKDRAARHGNKLYYRFNPEGLEDMRLDECKSGDRTFHAMSAACASYVDLPDIKMLIHECAQELVRHRRSRVSREQLLQFHDLTAHGPRQCNTHRSDGDGEYNMAKQAPAEHEILNGVTVLEGAALKVHIWILGLPSARAFGCKYTRRPRRDLALQNPKSS